MADVPGGAGRRVRVGADGSKTYMGFHDKTEAESAPSLALHLLGFGQARAAGKALDRKRNIDDGTDDPTRVEYGGHRGSSTGQ